LLLLTGKKTIFVLTKYSVECLSEFLPFKKEETMKGPRVHHFKMEESMEGPRLHHYAFAHKIIPSTFFQYPANFIMMLSQRADEILHEIWNHIGQKVEPEDIVAPEGLACEVRRVEGSKLGALISLPPPQRVTEAYFVAPVFQPPMEGKEAQARYITLEYNPEYENKSVLCEWEAEGPHVNSGAGPEPNLEDFWKAVCTEVSC
jgi:hypothetical protein